ncbi:hypothetical protein BpHYR1_041178, partial [Brachionus plicatilis]
INLINYSKYYLPSTSYIYKIIKEKRIRKSKNRKSRVPFTIKKTFENYGLISSKEIADEINRIFGRTISQQTVWHYRVQFGRNY